MSDGEGGGLEPRSDTEFRQDALHMGPYGVGADRQFTRNRGVVASLHQQLQDLQFPGRELARQERSVPVFDSKERAGFCGPVETEWFAAEGPR